MKALFIAASAALCVAFSGCVSSGTQTPDQVAANLHVQVTKACAVAQPTLASVSAMQSQLAPAQQTDLATASKIINSTCAANAALTTANAVALTQIAFPAVIGIVDASSMPQQDKITTEIALTAASVAVSAALAQYAAPVVVPSTPASAPVPASA